MMRRRAARLRPFRLRLLVLGAAHPFLRMECGKLSKAARHRRALHQAPKGDRARLCIGSGKEKKK